MSKSTLLTISDGVNGVRDTLKLMGQIVTTYKKAPVIREIASQIIQSVPEKNWSAEARAILRFVQTQIRYTKDVRGVETLQSPIQTLKLGMGDCDDKSTLIATLMESIGHPTRFIAVGKVPEVFCHVYVETKIGNKWVAMEGCEDWPLGRAPEGVACYMKHTNRR